MIVVTGASGKLGPLVVEHLLKTTPAREIVAAVRDPRKAADLAARGVAVREADYDRPETLAAAFAGATKLLLISGNELGRRVTQHAAAIEAARAAGADLIAYTSILKADTSSMILAVDHVATERLVRDSGVPFALLRNGWYHENRTDQAETAASHGVLLGAAGSGRFAAAARADYAAAAARVLTTPGHEGKVYELAGDAAYTLAELAAAIGLAYGRDVAYKDVPPEAYAAALAGFGVPAQFVHVLADSDRHAALGELDSNSRDLRTLIGRPTTTLADSLTREAPTRLPAACAQAT